MTKKIYLDYHATTPTDPRVVESMLPYFTERFGNTMSSSHSWGWAAEEAITKARRQIADLLHCKPSEIYFTSGATESNNWVVRGLIDQIRSEEPDAKIHMITGNAEHSSVLNTFKAAQKNWNVEVDFVKVDCNGKVPVEQVKKLIKPYTRLISVTWVQNEIGTVNDIEAIGQLARENKIYFHTDGTQAVGKLPIDLEAMPIDLLACSAHKFYGPKGVGFLYQRSAAPKVRIQPLFYGGGHERGERSGTLNTPGVVGMGMACEILSKEMSIEMPRQKALRDRLLAGLLKLPHARLNGHPVERSAININISFLGKKTESVLAQLSSLGFSSGAACMSGNWSATPVLRAIGVSDEQAQGTIRLSVGRWTTEQDIDQALELLVKAFG